MLGIENLDEAKIILAQINDYKLINSYKTPYPRLNYIFLVLL